MVVLVVSLCCVACTKETATPTLSYNGIDINLGTPIQESLYECLNEYYPPSLSFYDDLELEMITKEMYSGLLDSQDDSQVIGESLSVNPYTIVMGGQLEDYSYLACTVTNTGGSIAKVRDCPVTAYCTILTEYNRELIKLNSKEVSLDYLVEEFGDSYKVRDVTEYGYIYDYMYMWETDSWSLGCAVKDGIVIMIQCSNFERSVG